MITDTVATHFASNRVRSTATQLTTMYYVAKALVNDWNAQNMAARLAPGDNTIVDEGATDGRNPISADDCYAIILRAQAFVDDMEASSNAHLNSILKAGLNTIR